MRKKAIAYNDLSRKVAIVWTRVSSFQQERENCSLDTQREDCERFAAENGIRIKYYLGGKYESAKNEGKGFKEMLALARKDKEVNVILVRTSSRFSRIGLEASVIKSQLRAQGIYVIPAKEFYNPDDKMCRMMDSIRDVFNNTENEQRKDATYSGTIAALNRGEWCLQVPFGFKRVRKEGTHHILEITPEGELLRNAWIWRAKGEKLQDIVDKLNAMGLRLKSGRPMHLKRLSKILQNPFYYGYIESELIENEEHRIKGNFPALIDEPTFRKANGSSFAGYEQAKEPEYAPMNTFIRCARCGCVLSGYEAHRKNKNGRERLYRYYKCSTYGCKCNVNADSVHKEFGEMLGAYRVDERYMPLLRRIIERELKVQNKENEDNNKVLKARKTELMGKLDKVRLRNATEEIDKEDYEVAKKILLEQIAQIDEEFRVVNELSSNVSSKIDKALVTASQLGSLWNKMDSGNRKKLEFLVFPDGIEYDVNSGISRTPRTNVAFVLILLYYNELQAQIKARGELNLLQFSSWSRRGDSNTRPLRPERSALPTALLLDCFGQKEDYLPWQISRFCESGCKGTAFF